MRAEVLEKARNEPRGTPARILDAAEEVFAQRGFSGASTREIARRARVPFGALHYHWGSKRGLWQAVCERMIERTRETLLGSLVAGKTPGEMLDNLTDAFVDLLVANRNHTLLVCRDYVDDPRDLDVQRRVLELGAFGQEIFQQMAPTAELDVPLAIHLVSHAFIAALADEHGQELFLGGSAYKSRAARERLRSGLRRMARAVFGVTG